MDPLKRLRENVIVDCSVYLMDLLYVIVVDIGYLLYIIVVDIGYLLYVIVVDIG